MLGVMQTRLVVIHRLCKMTGTQTSAGFNDSDTSAGYDLFIALKRTQDLC